MSGEKTFRGSVQKYAKRDIECIYHSLDPGSLASSVYCFDLRSTSAFEFIFRELNYIVVVGETKRRKSRGTHTMELHCAELYKKKMFSKIAVQSGLE